MPMGLNRSTAARATQVQWSRSSRHACPFWPWVVVRRSGVIGTRQSGSYGSGRPKRAPKVDVREHELQPGWGIRRRWRNECDARWCEPERRASGSRAEWSGPMRQRTGNGAGRHGAKCRPARRPLPRTFCPATDWLTSLPMMRDRRTSRAARRCGSRLHPRAIEIFVERPGIVGDTSAFERGDDKAWIGPVQRVLGLADHATCPAQLLSVRYWKSRNTRAGLPELMHNCLACAKAGPERAPLPVANCSTQTEHVVDSVRLTPTHELIVAEPTVCPQGYAHARPRLRRICAVIRATSSTAPSLPPTFARLCRAKSKCRPQNM